MLAPNNELTEDLDSLSALEQAERLKYGLVARAEGNSFTGGNAAYRTLRLRLRQNPQIDPMLPSFIRECSDLDQFWAFIRGKFPTYKERREFIWDQFRAVIQYLENADSSPGMFSSSQVVEQFGADAVSAVWQRALARRVIDPEGAITAARTLVESVCKHILDDEGIAYGEHEDLPRLWHLVAGHLKLAPSQHQEVAFRTILGNCQSIVSQFAGIRNSIGDAHGTGRRSVRPKSRHAELVVNLAGAMSAFLISTHQERST